MHTEESLHEFWRRDIERRQPSLVNMCASGVILHSDGGLAESLANEAATLLAQGPRALSDAERDARRYAISDALDDLSGTESVAEAMVIGAMLLQDVANFSLAAAQRWEARGKWTFRLFEEADPAAATSAVTAFRRLATDGVTGPFITWADGVLGAHGGRLFEGYRVVAAPSPKAPGATG